MFGFAQPRSEERVRVPKIFLNKLRLFQEKPELIDAGQYTITSDVAPEIVDMFFARIGGDTTGVVTAENAKQLRMLCDELGFSGFDDEFRWVLASDSKMRKELMGLRSRLERHDVLLEELQRRMRELEHQVREQREVPERVEALERNVEDIRHNNVQVAIDEATRETNNIRTDVSALKEEVARLKEAEARRAATISQRSPVSQVAFTPVTAIACVYNPSTPLQGIIAYLTNICGQYVWQSKIVEVTASSCCQHRNSFVANVTELGTRSWFSTLDEPNSWISYDFKERRVALASYSITSACTPCPMSWVLEVSNAGSEGSWQIVDYRVGTVDLNGDYVTHNFVVSVLPHGIFRFVRIRQIGKNCWGKDEFRLSSFEVFGTLYSP